MADQPRDNDATDACTACRAQPSRRTFLAAALAAGAAPTGLAGLLGAGAAVATSGCASVPKTTFAAGSTSQLAEGERRFLDEQNVFLVRTAQGFAAISAICTHLGCRVSEVPSAGYDCGCHGSAFAADGSVVEGPADAPLQWYAVRIEGDQILVDGASPVPTGSWTPAP